MVCISTVGMPELFRADISWGTTSFDAIVAIEQVSLGFDFHLIIVKVLYYIYSIVSYRL